MPSSEHHPDPSGIPKPADESADQPTVDPAEVEEVPGAEIIRRQLKSLPMGPGVYRMFDRKGDLLYVGKAKNLRKRVASYTKSAGLTTRILRMVQMTRTLEVASTHTEVEALLLEANMIKRLKPRFNVILRDDKSFPYILITDDHGWPQITKYRGARNRKGEYYGPFASAGAVHQTLAALQRAFPLRSCTDSEFELRTRPCLMYQIKRCTAPCVGRISADDYAALVKQTRDFLSGKSQQVQKRMADAMQAASEKLDYETAAIYRDRIRALAHIHARQGINVEGVKEADVIAAHQEAGQTCIQVFFFRAGQNYGNRAYFPSHGRDQTAAEVLAAFVSQFYDSRPPPKQVMLSESVDGQALIAEALSIRADRKVEVTAPHRGPKRKLVDQALVNARDALGRRFAESASQRKLLTGVAEAFGLDNPPQRIEVYDNSHISGTEPVGAMIVAGPDGMNKAAYRKFNIKSKEIAPGDDYAMLREVLNRRFARLMKEDPGREEAGRWPDLLLIDGGRGQLGVAVEVLSDLGVSDLAVVGIAKGPDRNAGREQFFLPGKPPFSMPERDPVLYFLQRLRDEAHRFAIGTHRARRSKAIVRSPLDEIPGVGARRKKALLLRFGSAKAVAQAGLEDLAAVDGISKAVAHAVYDHFHPEG